MGLEAALQLAARGPTTLTQLDFVIGGVAAQQPWRDWLRVGKSLLGHPVGLEADAEFAEAAATGEVSWEVEYAPKAEQSAPQPDAPILPVEQVARVSPPPRFPRRLHRPCPSRRPPSRLLHASL